MVEVYLLTYIFNSNYIALTFTCNLLTFLAAVHFFKIPLETQWCKYLFAVFIASTAFSLSTPSIAANTFLVTFLILDFFVKSVSFSFNFRLSSSFFARFMICHFFNLFIKILRVEYYLK